MCLLLEVEKETAVIETRKVPHFQEWSEACSRFSSRPRLLYLSLSLSLSLTLSHKTWDNPEKNGLDDM